MRRSEIVSGFAIAAFLAIAAGCAGPETGGKGWGHTVDFDDSAKLAIGVERLQDLQADLLDRGYEPAGRSSSSASGPANGAAERTELTFRGDEPGLGEVEIVAWHWDSLRADERELGIHLSARVPLGTDGDAAWNGLVSRLREYILPRQTLIEMRDSAVGR